MHLGAQVVLEKGGGIVGQVHLSGQPAAPKHLKILITDPAGLVRDSFNLLLNMAEEQRRIGTSLMHNVRGVRLSLRSAVAFLSTFHVHLNFSLMAFNASLYLQSEWAGGGFS